MAKCKLCPHRRTCRNECYGDNPCDFAMMFDKLAHRLDLKTVGIESLRSERDKAVKVNECVFDISMLAQHMIDCGSIEVEDSRELFSSILEWAKEFEVGFSEKDDDACLYMERICEYAEEKLRATYGKKKEMLFADLDEAIDMS